MRISSQEKVNQIRTRIVSMLCSSRFTSGEALASTLGITRSSVSNHIKALSELGLDIYSVKGRGYKLAHAQSLLDEGQIRARATSMPEAKLLVRSIVGSTNDIIKQQSPQLSQGSTCIAEAQTKGRGRRGRKWVSPFGASIYFSMLWRFESGYQSMAGLSLLIGLGLKRALARVGLNECKLKWPNDVYCSGKKLAGILVEVEGQVGELTTAIIGIGVNIRLPDKVEGIDQAFTDVFQVLGKHVDRNQFVAYLLEELWQMLPQFQAEGLVPFLSQWQAADLYLNKAVSLVSGSFVSKGISRGIDTSGALLLECDGKIKPYHGGEISVRPL